MRLSDASVSRQHADIVRLSGGRIQVTDRGSTNGTFALDHGTWRAIQCEILLPADRVRFGDHEMTVGQLAALCFKDTPQVSGGVGPSAPSSGVARPRATTDEAALDHRRGLVRDAETGEIIERPPPAGGRRPS